MSVYLLSGLKYSCFLTSWFYVKTMVDSYNFYLVSWRCVLVKTMVEIYNFYLISCWFLSCEKIVLMVEISFHKVHTEKSFLNLVESIHILIVIALFSIEYGILFGAKPIIEKCNYNPNLVWFNKIQTGFLSVMIVCANLLPTRCSCRG